MTKRIELAAFTVGCAIFVAGLGIGYGDWGKLSNQAIVMQTLMGASVAILAMLITMAVIIKGRDRWRAAAFGSIILTLGLVVWLVDVGLLFAPIPFAMLLYSLSRLRRHAS